jgi:hypothetical protein
LQRFPIIFSAAIVLILLIFFHFRGLTYFDEGYILNSALRTAQGQIPYKDFDMVYTPLSYVITAGFLTVFGESVFVGRIAALTLSVSSLYAIYSILKLFANNGRLIFGTLLFFIAWGPTHINFPWPTMFAICFFLYALLFYTYGLERKSGRYFFLAGVMTVLTFLSKQNFGAGTFMVLSVMFFIIGFENRKKLFLNYLYGISFTSGLFILILFLTNSFLPFLQNMYLYTLKRVFVDKSLETPFLYEGSLFIKFIKLLFYTSPLFIAIVAFFAVLNSNRKLIILPIATAMFYILGIRPTTDYVHVVSLLAIACIPFAIIITYLKNKILKYVSVGVFIFLIILGFYTAHYKGYYQWEAQLKDNTSFVTHPRVQVYLTDQQSQETNMLINYIQQNTTKEDYIFVNYYAPLIYFITDRKNPTAYDLISTNQLPLTYQMKIIDTVIEKNVTLIISHELNKNDTGIISDYVKKKYKVKKIIGPYIIYEKDQ